MIFKDVYLQLSIKKQIVIGILCVTCFTSVIVVILIAINSLIFFRNAAHDVSIILDTLEDKSFGSFETLYDLSQVTLFDTIKVEVQTFRNYIENFNNNLDLFKTIKINDTFFHKSSATSTSTSTGDCLKNISECKYLIYNYSDIDENIQRALMLFIPVARISFLYKTNLNISLLSKISYSLINEPQLFLFPFTSQSEINPKFNSVAFDTNYNIYHAVFYSSTRTLLEPYNNMKSFTLEEVTIKNPFIAMLNHKALNITSPHNSKKVESSQTISYNYTSNIKAPGKNDDKKSTLKTISNASNLHDYIHYEWSDTIFDQMSSKLGVSFPGVGIMASLIQNKTNDTRYITTINTCYYLRKVYSFYCKEKLTTEEIFSPVVQFEDCFIRNASAEDAKLGFNNDNYYTWQINRKKIITLAQTHKNTMLLKEIEFKIFQYQNPSQSARRLVGSYFNTNFISINYVFKNRSFILITKNILTVQLYELIYVIIIGNIVYWLIIHLIVAILSVIMANTISKPFDELLERISSRNKESDDYSQPEKAIEFKYDSDINELFKICDGFLKGGFQEESKRKKTKIVNAYNNISLVKTNNLLFNEKEIYSKKDENMRIIFEYGNILRSASKKNIDKEKPNVVKLIVNKGFGNSSFNNINVESNEDINNKKKDDLRILLAERCEFVNEKTIAENEKNDYYFVLEKYLATNSSSSVKNS